MSLSQPQAVEVCWNPSELLMAYQQALQVAVETEPLHITGIYEAGNGQLYGAYYYDRLRDAKAQAKINILIPRHMKASLEEDKLLELRGMIQRKIHPNGYFTLQIIASELIEQKHSQPHNPDEERRQLLWEQRLEKPTQLVEESLRAIWDKGQPVRICCLLPTGSIVEKEMKEAVGTADAFIHWDIRRCSFHRKDEFLHALKLADESQSHLLGLVRGGGEGLDVFNDPDLGAFALTLSTPWVTALGHATDQLFLKKLANQSFNTPTAFGQFLAQSYERFHDNRENSKARLSQEIRQQIAGHLDALEKQQQLLQQQASEHKEIGEKWRLEAQKQSEQFHLLLRDMEKRQSDFQEEKRIWQNQLNLQETKFHSEQGMLRVKLHWAAGIALALAFSLLLSFFFAAR